MCFVGGATRSTGFPLCIIGGYEIYSGLRICIVNDGVDSEIHEGIRRPVEE